MNNLKLFLLAVDFLIMLGGQDKLSADLNAKIKGSKVTVDPSTLFVRKNITSASSDYDFIDAQTDKIKGISSIKGQSLNKNEAIIFHAVAIGYSEGAMANGVAGQSYNGDVPAALRNASLVIKQNGREVLNEPIANFVKGEATTNPGDYYLELPSFRYLADDTPFDIKVEFPAGVSMPAPAADNGHYMELRLLGQKTVAKI